MAIKYTYKEDLNIKIEKLVRCMANTRNSKSSDPE